MEDQGFSPSAVSKIDFGSQEVALALSLVCFYCLGLLKALSILGSYAFHYHVWVLKCFKQIQVMFAYIHQAFW